MIVEVSRLATTSLARGTGRCFLPYELRPLHRRQSFPPRRDPADTFKEGLRLIGLLANLSQQRPKSSRVIRVVDVRELVGDHRFENP